jgi:hypothetical protein
VEADRGYRVLFGIGLFIALVAVLVLFVTILYTIFWDDD